jgi:hypothetical protein
LRITTLGALVGLPPAFKKVKQYLGALDWFGGANSSLGVMHERVVGAGHHLNPGLPYHMSVAALLNGGTAPRLLPKPSIAEVLAPLSVPPVAAAPEPMAAVRPMEALRKPEKKAARPSSVSPRATVATPKVASPAPRVTSPAPKMASAPLRVASPAPKLAPKVSAPTPKPPVEQVKEPGIAAKQAIRPAAKKAVEARPEPVRPTKPKTAAVNGKLVVKKSKKEVR